MFITAEGFVICDVTAKIFVVYFHKIKSWDFRNLCILVEHAPGAGHTATELVPASGDECYLLFFSWAVSPHVPAPPPPPPRDSIDWCIILDILGHCIWQTFKSHMNVTDS